MYLPSVIDIINRIYRYGHWARIFKLGEKAFAFASCYCKNTWDTEKSADRANIVVCKSK